MTDIGFNDEVHVGMRTTVTTPMHSIRCGSSAVRGTEVRCRLMCHGCYQETTDKGDTYTSTPLLVSLKLCLLLRLGSTRRAPPPSTA